MYGPEKSSDEGVRSRDGVIVTLALEPGPSNQWTTPHMHLSRMSWVFGQNTLDAIQNPVNITASVDKDPLCGLLGRLTLLPQRRLLIIGLAPYPEAISTALKRCLSPWEHIRGSSRGRCCLSASMVPNWDMVLPVILRYPKRQERTVIPKLSSTVASSWDMKERGRLGNTAGDLTPDVLSKPLKLDGVPKAFQQTVSHRALIYVHRGHSFKNGVTTLCDHMNGMNLDRPLFWGRRHIGVLPRTASSRTSPTTLDANVSLYVEPRSQLTRLISAVGQSEELLLYSSCSSLQPR